MQLAFKTTLLVISCTGSCYLQSSVIQLQIQVIKQHYHNQEQTEHIEQLNKKNTKAQQPD